ncbi:hypothetical protein PUR21_16600 [Methylorubrum rhodesianum]|uniref:Uncharacterized protein n=1 Tax=Methylorubrum rhodesianum TaxID=29427 RepID=A0ABU9ZCT8_9HYPH
MAESTPIQSVERRQWWPASFLDESMPHGRATPDAWLCHLDDGAHAYGIPGDDDGFGPKAISEGEVVEFSACDTLGSALLTFSDDGEPVWQPEIPAEVDHLWDGSEIISDSPADFAEQIKEAVLGGYAEDDERTLAMLSRWPGDALRFQFTALDGLPRFLPLDPVPEPPSILLSAPIDPQADLFHVAEAPGA